MAVVVRPADLADFVGIARVALSRGRPLRLSIGRIGDYEVSHELAAAIVELLDAAASGHAIDVAALPDEITTGQAADLLGVSRPTVVSLVDKGDLPARRIGTHRRLRTTDVLAFRARTHQDRSAALNEVTAISEDLGLYDGE